MDSNSFVTNSLEETQRIAWKLAKKLEGGDLIALYGSLGSGKTTFVQGLAKGLGIKKRIISPTFVIVRKYRVTNYKLPITNFYHTDLYRIESQKDLFGLGLKEIMNNSENIIVIEWAEKMESILPKDAIKIYLEYVDEKSRKIQIK